MLSHPPPLCPPFARYRWRQGTSINAITTTVSGSAYSGQGGATLQWTPQARGTFYFTCTAANAVGGATSLPFTVVVA